MKTKKTARTCLAAALMTASLTALPACSLPKRKPAQVPAAGPSAEKTEPAPAAVSEADRAMAAGDYEKALELFRAHYDLDRSDSRLRSAYAAALESVKKEADSARSQGRYGTAGRFYRLLADGLGRFPDLSSALSFGAAEIDARVRECRAAVRAEEAGQALAAGRHDKAFSILAGAAEEDPGGRGLRPAVELAFKETKKAAEQALAAGEFAAAGKKFALLRDAPARLKALVPAAETERESLERSLRKCSDGLTNLGLVEYRKGNLAGAVAMWESLLAFEPDNAEIKKAVQTARAQLEKIKK